MRARSLRPRRDVRDWPPGRTAGVITVGTLQVGPRPIHRPATIHRARRCGRHLRHLGTDDILGALDPSSRRPPQRPDGLIESLAGGRPGDLRNETQFVTKATPAWAHADVILGDNGNIYRVVTAAGSSAPSVYRSFEYDNGYGEQLIVRAPKLLDYTPGGILGAAPATDIGSGDELHGESGDDAIYGQKGDDVLFGEGQDDDLIGGTGNDWISGGTGDDGVIGDDGRLSTSRNNATTGEPLYAVTPLLLNDPSTKDTNGNVLGEIISPRAASSKPPQYQWAGQEDRQPHPFSVDPTWQRVRRPLTSSSVPLPSSQFRRHHLWWLGQRWLHGGSGDDALSGAEARAEFYGTPINLGNALAYSATTGTLPSTSSSPRSNGLSVSWLNLTHSKDKCLWSVGTGYAPKPTDGDDKIFGDLGNDWLVGGSGRDDLYGGWGDDLLNVDDDQSTNNGLNNIPDTHPSYEDRAYGGAGRDVLIANTGGDRLIDWAGEFNSYLVPFAPFGLATISRALQPQIAEFLYALSASDGADPTRVADIGSSAEQARNGEPYGELGLVRQQDFAWQEQTGGPRDVQAGNIPGGPRDVLRSAISTTLPSTASSPTAASGRAQNGVLQVSAGSWAVDAVSVFHVGDALPGYFEVQASVMAIKPTAGWKANAYMIFDYQGKDDFKFAGLDVSLSKLVMGHRDVSGWHVDKQAPVPGGVKSDKYYNLLLAVNGVNATLLVDNQQVFTHTYQPRVVKGYAYGLNGAWAGRIGQFARPNLKLRVQVAPAGDFDQTRTSATA